MTMPTQADKIDAVAKAMAATEPGWVRADQYVVMAKAAIDAMALIAAAQVGPAVAFEMPKNEIKGIKVEGCTFEAAAQAGEQDLLATCLERIEATGKALEAATIERCAQVAEQWEREGYPGDFKTLLTRIRKLKDET